MLEGMGARAAASILLGALLLPVAGAAAQDHPGAEPTHVRLRELEERVERLRDRVRREGRVEPAVSLLVVELGDRLGAGLRVARAEVTVRGRSHALVRGDDGRLRARIPVTAGAAELSVAVVVVGDGGGVFTYLEGYRTTLEARRGVRLPVLSEQVVQVVVWEGGSPTSTFCERPRIGLRVALP